jgi:hypothetical protein
MMLVAAAAPAASEAAASSGGSTWIYVVITAIVLVVGVVVLVIAAKKKGEVEVPCRSCQRVLMPDWDTCQFCGAPRVQRVARLEFISGPMQGSSTPLEADVTTIGSVAGNRVVLTDTGVSRKHVGIKRLGHEYELADLGSTNGVYVNGEKVARRKLQAGDVIRVGASEMVFRSS